MKNKPKRTFSILCLVGWLVGALVSTAFAQEEKCDICGQKITGKFYTVEDRAVGGKVKVCVACSELDERCFMCGLPVKKDYQKLTDGRLLCARDAKEAVDSEEEAKRICGEIPQELNRTFARFITLPADDVVISIVDRFHLESLFKAPGYDRACTSVFGATQSHELPGGKHVHSISILSNLRKPRLQAVAAHEFAHTWINENVPPERKAALSADAVEGFCEWLAYDFMEAQHEPFEMSVIKASAYTKGQVNVMLETETHYGFNAVLEWMKAGEDGKLQAEDLSRVNALAAGLSKRPEVPGYMFVPAAPPPSPPPDKLVLKGISGTSRWRFAVINNRTFEPLERGRVPLGETNVAIRCLEIRADSVVVQVEGSTAKQEIFLRVK
jgi:hypothetical protein